MKSNKLKTRLYYGLGSVGVAIMDAFLGSFLTLYVTDVLKIDALLFSSILIGPKIFDIVIDIFIMYFVGKTKSKRGMYIPWLINMVPLAIALVLMFTTPYFAISTNWVIVVLVVTYFISSALCDSFYYIPYLAIPGVISEDNEEIVELSSSKSIFENLSYTLVSIVTMPILLACGGHKNNDGWLIAAGIFAFLSILCTSFMFFGVKTIELLAPNLINLRWEIPRQDCYCNQ